MSSETKISFEPIAEAIALEAGRIIYGLSYVAAMKRQGFEQAIFAQPRTYLDLGRPLEYVEVSQ